MIFGINDEKRLVGIKSKSKIVDKFKLSIDDKIANNSIIYQDDEIIKEKYVDIHEMINERQQLFIVITIIPQKDRKYKLINGTIVHRLNASNQKIKTVKLLSESTHLVQLETEQKKLIQYYDKIIKSLNSDKILSEKKINEYVELLSSMTYKYKILLDEHKKLSQEHKILSDELTEINNHLLDTYYPAPIQIKME